MPMIGFPRAVESFDPRGAMLSWARSLLAVAQLSMILVTPDSQLFVNIPSTSLSVQCTGLKTASLWCVTGAGLQPDVIGRAIAVIVLLVVASGYRPRWSCIPHWYIAFSIAVDVSTIDGGDRVAEILTMLLIPVCLGDTRTWTWQRPVDAVTPLWRGAGLAGHYVLRVQAACIYLDAAFSKLDYPAWRRATALRVLVDDPTFGAPPAFRPIAERILSNTWTSHLLTWGVIVIEVLIALSLAFSPIIRRFGMFLAIMLHGAIILLMGLFSFGMIMIALLMAACADGRMLTPQVPINSPRRDLTEFASP